MTTRSSSSGWRSDSSTSRSNSASSSRKRIPWSAREISPGVRFGPAADHRRVRQRVVRCPERRATSQSVDRPVAGGRGDDGDGERRRRRRGVAASRGSSAPAGSCRRRAGRTAAGRGLPRRAISSARRACDLAADLGQVRHRGAVAIDERWTATHGPSKRRHRVEVDRHARYGDRGLPRPPTGARPPPPRPATRRRRRPRPRRGGLRPGRRRRRRPDRAPARASAATIGRMPGTPVTSPPSESSPRRAVGAEPALVCSDPSRMPTAMARSSDAPALRRSAGARLTVIRRAGNVKPALRIAPRTRSRASFMAVSGRPTMVNPGNPGATSTSTRMTRPSRPRRVAEATTASMRSR